MWEYIREAIWQDIKKVLFWSSVLALVVLAALLMAYACAPHK